MKKCLTWCLGCVYVCALGCGDDGAVGSDGGGADTAAPDAGPAYLASCVYENTFADTPECREYTGSTWTDETAAADCEIAFFGGELTIGMPCTLPREIGRCTIGEPAEDGYVVVSTGTGSACGPAKTGCEVFAQGTFVGGPVCESCSATGDERPGAVVPRAPDCREALPGEPPGLSDGQVCTTSLISASTEPGRKYSDYASCDTVRSQRPYAAIPNPVEADPADPRLSDSEYMVELDWVREEAEASACACCHTASDTPSGAAIWDTEAGALWIDTVRDEALAMLGGYTDSAAFGYFAAEENNGFDRSTTGLPTTDVARLRAFVAQELERRGISEAEAAELPPFAPFFQELIDHVPEACEEGVGVDDTGRITWTGGAARYVWILAPDSASPGNAPNWDLPDGTLWAIAVEGDADPMSCGMNYGEALEGVVQRIPETGEAPALVTGQTYYLAVMRDLAQPITRCLFEMP